MHNTYRTKNNHVDAAVYKSPMILIKLLIYLFLKDVAIYSHFVTNPLMAHLGSVCEGFIHRVIHRICVYSANMRQHKGLAVRRNNNSQAYLLSKNH